MKKPRKPRGLRKPKQGGWGGWRPGAGRKPSGKIYVKHRPRPAHDATQPVLVKYRAAPGTGGLRGRAVAAAVRDMIATVTEERRRAFRVCHYAVLPGHVHLLVEATSKRALERGLQGLASGMARRINAVLGRSGTLWAERYDARALATAAEVQRALREMPLLEERAGESAPVAAPQTRLLRAALPARA